LLYVYFFRGANQITRAHEAVDGIRIVVFSAMTPYILVGGYKHIRGKYSIFLEDGELLVQTYEISTASEKHTVNNSL
jgi:hypothetical protein